MTSTGQKELEIHTCRRIYLGLSVSMSVFMSVCVCVCACLCASCLIIMCVSCMLVYLLLGSLCVGAVYDSVCVV